MKGVKQPAGLPDSHKVRVDVKTSSDIMSVGEEQQRAACRHHSPEDSPEDSGGFTDLN